MTNNYLSPVKAFMLCSEFEQRLAMFNIISASNATTVFFHASFLYLIVSKISSQYTNSRHTSLIQLLTSFYPSYTGRSTVLPSRDGGNAGGLVASGCSLNLNFKLGQEVQLADFGPSSVDSNMQVIAA